MLSLLFLIGSGKGFLLREYLWFFLSCSLDLVRGFCLGSIFGSFSLVLDWIW